MAAEAPRLLAPVGRQWRAALAAAIVLLCLVPDVEAQRRGGGKRGRGGRAGAAAGRAPESKAEEKEFLPGFDTPPAKAPKQEKASTQPKARPEPPKPPDPGSEADGVTAEADHHARLAAAEEQLLQDHFRLCDLDENGWISLREAQAALALERAEYQRLDANQDGRLDAMEFAREPRTLLARLGARLASEPGASAPEPPAEPEAERAPAPEPAAPPTAAARPSPLRSEFGAMTVKPGAFLRRFDTDASGGVNGTELEAALAEGGLPLSAAQALEVLDRNDSGQLEGGELFPFAWLASRARPAPVPPSPPEPAPPEPSPAETPPAAVREREPGPGRGSHFARLDPGRDGFIDEADLRTLQSPARLDLRLRAVLSALDRDGDGRLSESEFRAAMGDAPHRAAAPGDG